MKIKLDELAMAFRTSDVLQGYVDIRQGKVVLLEDEFRDDAQGRERTENDVLEHVFSVEDDWENYVPIPNVYDGNEREIMAGFAEKLEAPQREELLGALKGSGAVGRFHREIRRLRLAEEWENFQEEWFHALAQEWCEENALAYE